MVPQENTTQFSINTLSFDGAKLWNKFCCKLIHKEINLTKSKFKILSKTHFLNTYV